MRALSLLPLLAFLTGCQSPSHPAAPAAPDYHVDLGVIDTYWGKLHAYDRLKPAHTAAPLIPHELRRPGFAATVIASLLVNPDGTVADTRVERTSGHPALDHAVLRALRQWRFTPSANSERVVTSQTFFFNVAGGGASNQFQ